MRGRHDDGLPGPARPGLIAAGTLTGLAASSTNTWVLPAEILR